VVSVYVSYFNRSLKATRVDPERLAEVNREVEVVERSKHLLRKYFLKEVNYLQVGLDPAIQQLRKFQQVNTEITK